MEVIEVFESKAADTRSADVEVTKEMLHEASVAHIRDVKEAMFVISKELIRMAFKHDHTKIRDIDQFYADFRTTQCNGANFTELPWYTNHVSEERHHLKASAPVDVNLLDVIECVVDCVVAGMARSGEVRVEKLNPEILVLAYENTIKLLKEHTKVVKKDA